MVILVIPCIFAAQTAGVAAADVPGFGVYSGRADDVALRAALLAGR